ncbi:hypothetical protein G9C98_000065 [Cotesia typhae]|uniref:Uncharacterized protein n=1 Tax=Cotesia typhae TaxID=2053667 RepID=A0A8J5RAP0_9HYME|nr:hypothetical protein G9C98_000065 [Cotesia typhae]
MNLGQSSWITPKKQFLNAGWIFEDRNNPDYGELKIHSTITTNKFVKFRASDLKKDAGQSTVSFFDGRQTVMYKSLLGGVGLVHRGPPGFGGHLALKVFDFDMSPYFNIIDDNSHPSLD